MIEKILLLLVADARAPTSHRASVPLHACLAVAPRGHLRDRSPASGPPRRDERHDHQGERRTTGVDGDIDGRWMAPGHEPLVQLVADGVEDPRPRQAQAHGPRRGRDPCPRRDLCPRRRWERLEVDICPGYRQ